MTQPDPVRLQSNHRKLTVVVTMEHAPGRLELLSPGARCEWGRCSFLLNPPKDTIADFWIVAGNARPKDRMVCAPQNTLLIAAEPLEKKSYPHRYYQQFHWVVDSHSASNHPRLSIEPLGFCWHIGMQQPGSQYAFGYDRLYSLPRPAKENRISVVCSDNRFTAGQRLRLDFLDEVKQELGDRIVHFGRGYTPISDKLDAILPHRFHLALENCSLPNYWSEKIADAYLAWAFPLYVGCPNLEDVMPSRSFVRIDPANAPESVAIMKRLLESPLTDAEHNAVAAGRNAILNVFNPIAIWARCAETRWRATAQERVVIRSHKAFRSLLRGFVFRWRMRNWQPEESVRAA